MGGSERAPMLVRAQRWFDDDDLGKSKRGTSIAKVDQIHDHPGFCFLSGSTRLCITLQPMPARPPARCSFRNGKPLLRGAVAGHLAAAISNLHHPDERESIVQAPARWLAQTASTVRPSPGQ